MSLDDGMPCGSAAALVGAWAWLPRLLALLWRYRATLQPPAQLDMAPCYVHDGLLAGPSAEVLRALQRWSTVVPRLGLRLSTASVAPVAGIRHEVDFRPFAALGCSICEDGNFEVLKSPVGDAAFNRTYCLQRAARQATVQLVGGLEDPQVAYYLLRWCCTGGRMNPGLALSPGHGSF